MRTMLMDWGKRSRRNQSRPSIKPDDRACEPQVVPFKKRARFLCSDDNRPVCQSEEIGASDNWRVCSRSDVANTGESTKMEIVQIEKKSSNTADEVTHDAFMSPVAIRPSEGRLPLATSASEEDRVKERERAKTPVINAPSEPQGSVVDGGIKQVAVMKEVKEHEGRDGGESTKSGPQGDGGNNDGVIYEKLLNQTKEVIQQEGGDNGSTGEPQVADQYKEVMKSGGNETNSNNARDDVNKIHQPEPVTNLDGRSSHSRADTTIKGKNINNETTNGKEPVDNVVSPMVVYSGHDLVMRALDRADDGNSVINEVGKELLVDVVSKTIVEGGRDWNEKALKLFDFRNRAINGAGGNGDFIEQQETVGDVSAMLVDNYGHDWEENALNIVGSGSRGAGANEVEGELETNVPLTDEHQKNSDMPMEYILIEISDSEHELEDPYSPIVGHSAPLNPACPIPNPEGGSGGGATDTAAINTKGGDASGGAAADGSPPMRDSGQQVHRDSTGTGDGERNNSQKPLTDGPGKSSMQRPKVGLRLLGFDI